MLKKKKSKVIVICSIVLVAIAAALPVILNDETKTLNSQTRTEAPGSFIELPNGITHYEEAGSDTAKTILLVHGFSVPYYIWDPTFEMLKDSGYHVIRFDLFGRGYSDRPELTYDKALFIKQINDLLAALNINKPIDIIGVSMGGALVTQYTLAYPEMVKKIILIDPVHEAAEISMLDNPIIGTYLMNVFVAPTFAKKQLKSMYNPEPYAYWPDLYKEQMKFKGFKKAIMSSLKNYMVIDKLQDYKDLDQLQKPILMFWGKEDATLPYKGNERIRKVLRCEFKTVEEAGHLPHYEKPEITNPQMVEFLSK